MRHGGAAIPREDERPDVVLCDVRDGGTRAVAHVHEARVEGLLRAAGQPRRARH